MLLRRATALLTLLAALAGCAPHPQDPPLLRLSRTECDKQPDFGSALPVSVDEWRGTSAVLGLASRCLDAPGGGVTTYAAFALPTASTPYTLAIISNITAAALVRPVAMLFDSAGKLIRTVPPDEFEQNVRGLRAGVRPTGTERWLVVAADRAQLGQKVRFQLGGADGRVQVAAAVFVPVVIIPPLTPDLVREQDAVISLNGRITVIAAPARMAQ